MSLQENQPVEKEEESGKQEAKPELHPMYQTDANTWYDTLENAAEAWLSWKFPSGSQSEEYGPGVILSSPHQKFIQNYDGSGVVEHAGDICAVRFKEGGVLLNQSCDPENHSWHPRHKISSVARFTRKVEETPFAFVEAIVEEETDLNGESYIFAASHMTVNKMSNEERALDLGSQAIMIHHLTNHHVVVGRDLSAHFGNRLFGFVVDGNVEDVQDASDAIDLLKPDIVDEHTTRTKKPARQGEWWFLLTGEEPQGSIQKPGVRQRPFGGSPLENHVPTEWVTNVPDGIFMDRVQDAIERHGIDYDPETPQEAVELVSFLEWCVNPPITMHDIRTMAEGIHVRGTVRHRNGEHSMLRDIEGWHRAVTHDQMVYTAEDVGVDVTISAD